MYGCLGIITPAVASTSYLTTLTFSQDFFPSCIFPINQRTGIRIRHSQSRCTRRVPWLAVSPPFNYVKTCLTLTDMLSVSIYVACMSHSRSFSVDYYSVPSLLSLVLLHTLTRLKVLLFIPVCVVCQVVLLARLLVTKLGQRN